MIVRENLNNGFIKVYSDLGKKIIDVRTGNEYSEAIIKINSKINFKEKEVDN